MVRVFVRHTVEDYQAWRNVYDEFDQMRRSMGVEGTAVFQSIDDPNDVTVWHDFDTAEAARAYVSSDELLNAMRRAGIEGDMQVWAVNPSYPG
jgi:heme-degrading monooxygenase HmoA